MKKIYLVLLIAISLSACKKDALKVDAEKTYIEQGVSSGTLGFGGVILKLMPDGKADILVGGDAWYRTTYKIKGDKLILIGDTQNDEFKIISDTELRYQNNRVLKLDEK
jgi:hypothetical protein